MAGGRAYFAKWMQNVVTLTPLPLVRPVSVAGLHRCADASGFLAASGRLPPGGPNPFIGRPVHMLYVMFISFAEVPPLASCCRFAASSACRRAGRDRSCRGEAIHPEAEGRVSQLILGCVWRCHGCCTRNERKRRRSL